MLTMPNQVFIAFMLYAFSTAITPGPNNFLTLNTVGRFGLQKSWMMMAGMICGIMIILSLTAALSFALKQVIHQLTVIAKYLGAIYIIYLSIKIYTSKPVDADPNLREPTFRNGMIYQFLNVKIILYAITSLNSFVLPYTSDVTLIILYALLLTSISVICLWLWGVLGVLLRDVMKRHYKLINTIMALILLESVFSLLF